ncbi:MAG: NAD(+)--rifampin ADP-ribosyltransferase [Mycetocola sp.]
MSTVGGRDRRRNGRAGMGKASTDKARRRQAREVAARTTFWHGGVAGLQVGDRLLSPELTNAISVSNYDPIARKNRVYFTTDRQLARAYASLMTEGLGHGALYRVAPVGDTEADPDFPAAGFQARSAFILEVEECDTLLSPSEAGRARQPYTTWDDGRLMWDRRGQMQLNRHMEAYGLNQGHLNRLLPLWVTPEEASPILNDHLRRTEARGSAGNRSSS